MFIMFWPNSYFISSIIDEMFTSKTFRHEIYNIVNGHDKKCLLRNRNQYNIIFNVKQKNSVI